jgi:hypothetical protein
VSDRENRTLGEGEREGNPHSTTEAGGMDDTSTDAIRESIKLGFESVKHLGSSPEVSVISSKPNLSSSAP